MASVARSRSVKDGYCSVYHAIFRSVGGGRVTLVFNRLNQCSLQVKNESLVITERTQSCRREDDRLALLLRW